MCDQRPSLAKGAKQMAHERTESVFSEHELEVSKNGRSVIKDDANGRRIWLGPDSSPGPRLTVEGRGVPGSVDVRCYGYSQINLLARVLLDTPFDEKLIAR